MRWQNHEEDNYYRYKKKLRLYSFHILLVIVFLSVFGGGVAFSIYTLAKYKTLTDLIVLGFHLILTFVIFIWKE